MIKLRLYLVLYVELLYQEEQKVTFIRHNRIPSLYTPTVPSFNEYANKLLVSEIQIIFFSAFIFLVNDNRKNPIEKSLHN